MTPEGKVKEKVGKALTALGAYRFMPVQNGMGAPGLDFYCCIRGQFIAIETKAPGKKLTMRQELTAENIAQAGGKVFVIRDEADIVRMLQRISVTAQSNVGFVEDKLPACRS